MRYLRCVVLLGFVALLSAAPAAAQPEHGGRITILIDNYVLDSRLEPAWGFSALVDYEQQRVLFDTGDRDTHLLAALDVLEIDPASLETVVLSHYHADHTGGLPFITQTGARPTLYVLPSFPGYFKTRTAALAEIVEVEPGQAIIPGVHTTGEVSGPIPEQALVIATADGLIIVTGCAHPGIVEIVQAAQALFPDQPVRLVMGGFHLLEMGASQINAIIAELRALGVQQVAPTHCSGNLARLLFAAAYGEDYIDAGAGLVITFDVPPADDSAEDYCEDCGGHSSAAPAVPGNE
jgi:7,8-dihydropterin-6-yl-methyl-4-(beta-D-ribofuranosyl)aminobenzene 5'-phosphate synthase